MVNLILRVSFKLDTLTMEISRILNLLDSGETAPFTPMGEKPDLFDIPHNNVALFSSLNIVIRCSDMSIGLSINTLCGGILTAGGIPPLRNWLLSSTENTVVKYNQGVMTSPVGGWLENQGVTDNKKGSTANATLLNNDLMQYQTNDNSDNNANLFNILVQRGLIVNYSPNCLAFRCLRLISPCRAVMMNCAVLSPESFNNSTLSAISCGTRASSFFDFAFIAFVAISISFDNRWLTVYTKNSYKKALTWLTLNNNLVADTLRCESSKTATPRSATNTTEAFNHNVKRGNTMAMYKSTQTHPKFLWRFFSCQQFKYFLVEATNEQEARSMLPDSPCIFSARICQGVIHG